MLSSCFNSIEKLTLSVTNIENVTSNSFVVKGMIEGQGYASYGLLLKSVEDKMIADEYFKPSSFSGNYTEYCANLEANNLYNAFIYVVKEGDTIISEPYVVRTKEKMVFEDSRDGKKYEFVSIADQDWFVNNVDYNSPGSVYYNDSSMKDIGRLYSFEMAQNVCPEGWRLPSDNDWFELEKLLGVSDSLIDSFARPVIEGVANPLLNFDFAAHLNNTTTNEYGFDVKPTGFYSGNEYSNIDLAAYFWTSSKYLSDNQEFYICRIIDKQGRIVRHRLNNQAMAAVRCVKD